MLVKTSVMTSAKMGGDDPIDKTFSVKLS